MGLLGGIKLAPLLTEIKVDIKSFKSDMEKARTKAVGEAKKISKELEQTAKIGENFSKVGKAATKFITLPIAGAAAASAKLAVDFGDSMAKVSTIADTTKVPIDQLKSGIMDLSSKTGLSATDLNEALYETLSAGVDTASAIDFLGTATKAAKGGFTDTATAVDGLTTVLNSYGLKASEADNIANQMLITQNLGKTTFGELASAVGKVTPIASSLGVKTEELFSSLASTTAQGLDTAESVTALKAAMSNIIKPTTEAKKAAESLGIEFNVSTLQTKGWMPFLKDLNEQLRKSSPVYDELCGKYQKTTLRMMELEKAGKKNSEEYKNLSKSAKGTKDEMEILAQAADSPIGAFGTMFGSIEGLNSVLMLTSDNGMNLYNESMKQMKENTTALDDAFNKMDKTPGAEMRKALNEIKNIGIDIGDIVVPVIRDVLAKVNDLAQGFRDLSPEAKEHIVRIGVAAAAMGPLLSVTGKIIKAYTTIKPLLAGASVATKGLGAAASVAGGAGGLGVLAGGIGSAVVAAAPFALAIGGIGLAAYGVHKALTKEVVPSVDLFADKVQTTSKVVDESCKSMASATETHVVKISEETKNAVQSYMDMDDETTKAMYDMKLNHSVVTDELAGNMIGKFTTMGESIKTSQKQKYEEMYSDTSNFFANNSSLTEEREAEILSSITRSHGERQLVVDKAMSRITEIYRSAKERGVAITQEEQQEINALQEQMRNEAVTTLSATEEEAAVIRERMKGYQGRLTADMAIEMIQKANEARDGEIAAAEQKYDEVVRQATRLKAAGHITEEEYNQMVSKAEETKKGQIENAQQACDGVKEQIKEATPGIEDQVNIQTGKIKGAYEKIKDSLSNFFSWLFGKTDEAENKSKGLSHIGMGGGSSGGSRNEVSKSASGTPYWRGGLTMVHDSPTNNDYGEIMDLPRGTRIYPHDVSMKMAERVAEIVAGRTDNTESSEVNQTLNFYGKTESPYEVAKATKKAMKDLQFA